MGERCLLLIGLLCIPLLFVGVACAAESGPVRITVGDAADWPSRETTTLDAAQSDSSRDDGDRVAADAGYHFVEGDLRDPELLELQARIRECLAFYFERSEDASSRSPWGVMHAMLPFGVDAHVLVNGRKVNSIGWLCWNGACRHQRLFTMSEGKIEPQFGPGVQGHEGQFLSMLALSRVPKTYPMKVNGHDLTVADLVEYEGATCFAGTELTFKLIGLVHYLDSDAVWTNRRGETWTLQRILEEELAQPVKGATCGGTHRVMGFSHAVRKRQKRGEPIDGQWLRAKDYVDDYHEYIFDRQNEDGSISTDWFRGEDESGGIDHRLDTTGHTLEWLVFSLPKNQLRDARVRKSVDYMTRLLWENREHEWEVGPKGHALHALSLFDERIFGTVPGQKAFLRAGD